ncbi:MAG TPA: S8 family serine peptidase, partial [Bryobacteraceae bacterium]|nr:S8 family serine peptidase [Bryobacteraceae bacterium]
KAWLGNYKIFGTPGINDVTSTSVLIQALEDAYTDGMDIAVLSVGTTPFTAPFTGPLETVSNCQQTQQIRSYIPINACDLNAYAVEHAVQAGMLVVVAAGNDGCVGLVCPTLGTIDSPGTAPSALTVGSTTNSHLIYTQVKIGSDVWKGFAGNGPRLASPLTAPAVDVSTIVSDGTICSGVPANSLAGKIAVVARGSCTFYDKVNIAQQAGALAVLMYDTSLDNIVQPSYLLNETAIPLEFVGVTAGTAIRAALKANTSAQVTIDPNLVSGDITYDTVAFDSSRGPVTGTSSLKPELAAIGSGVYTATQSYDPNGDAWDASGYAGVDGTSFAAAMAAGAAALVKQAHPDYTPAQIKSALVNNATVGVIMDPSSSALARVTAVGAGKLNAAAAISSNITVSPAVVSLGLIGTTLPAPITLTLANTGNSSLSLSLTLARRDGDSRATLNVSPSSLTLAAGQSQTVTVSLTGAVPAAGTYEGQINIAGAAGDPHIPFHYMVGDKTPANAFPVYGDNYFAIVTEYPDLIAFRVIDKNGAPISGAAVQWAATGGGAVDFRYADPSTDAYGIAAAYVQQSRTAGNTTFQGFISQDWGWEFAQFVNFVPQISGGIFNAATQQAGSLAPGSYASISGVDFSAVPVTFKTNYLPISLGEVSVTFDAPGISIPAPISYMSTNFINVQIPWELQGQTSATVKVRYHDIPGQTVSLPLAAASPAFFEYTDSTNNALSLVAQNLDYSLITSQNPAGRGKVITLYANGLGPVNDTPPTGQQSSGTVLSRTTTTPVVMIGGKPA